MITCKNCLFWIPQAPSPPDIPTLANDEYGECELMRSRSEEPDHPDSLAYAIDYDGFRATARTSSDFGCVQGKTNE